MRKNLLLALCALLFSCANPLKGKSPYWYNGYVYGTQAYGLFAQGKLFNAIAHYKKAVGEAERYDIPQQGALYKFNTGRCYYELDEFDSALSFFSACNRSICSWQTLWRPAGAPDLPPCAGAQREIRTVRLSGTNKAPDGHRRKTTMRYGCLSMAGFCGRAIMEKRRSIILRRPFPCIRNKKHIMPWRDLLSSRRNILLFGDYSKRENSL